MKTKKIVKKPTIKKNSVEKGLKEYREYVKKRLSELTPVLQKAAVGEFSTAFETPGQEDEFSELYVGLNLMMEDLKELEETRRKNEEERKKTEKERQKRMIELERWRNLTTERELRMVELKKELSLLKREINDLKTRLGEPITEEE